MLEDCLIESRSSARTKKPLTLVVSVLTHGSLIAGLILIPLFQEQLLPHVTLFEPLPPPTVQTRITELVPTQRASAPSQAAPTSSDLIAPLEIPREIARVVDEPIAGPAGFVPSAGGDRIGIPGLETLIGGPDFGGRIAPPPAPPAPPPAPPKAPEPVAVPDAPIRRSSSLMLASLIHQVQPPYPTLARATRTSGTVVIEAVITREGTIDPARLRVISGHVLLDAAAKDAVLQWRYKPTVLSGQPVEVMTTISINFSMN